MAEAGRFNVLACGRRWGKTELLKDVAIDQHLLAGRPVGWWSPTYKMLAEVWRDLELTLRPITASKNESEHRIELITGGVLDMWSLDAADTARGRHYSLAIIDEAAKVPTLDRDWNLVIRPMLIDLQGSAWFASTPNRDSGQAFKTMHRLARQGEQDWRAWTFTSYDNPHLDRAELEGLRATMTDEAYRQEIMAEFIEGEGAVFRNLAAACTAPMGDKPENHKGHVIVAGVDWGKQNDYTAISLGCVNCRREVVLDRFNQIDYEFQLQRLQRLFTDWSVRLGQVELNSIGQPMFERLARSGVPVVGFDTTATSKPPLIEALALALDQGSPLLLPLDWATAELEAYERRVNPNTGHPTYTAPDGLHDDTVMARALMNRAMNQHPRLTKPQANPWLRR